MPHVHPLPASRLTSARFLLRRAAVRAISQQPVRQLSTLRPSSTSRLSLCQNSRPIVSRSFHQARIWRAEDKKDAEELKEQVEVATEQAEDAAAAAQEAAEDAAAASSAPDAPPEAVQQAQEVAQGEASIASDAAETAANAAAKTQSQASPRATSSHPPEPAQPGAAPEFFPPRDSPTASGISPPPPTRILYVGNLFFEVTAAQLEQEFGRYGTITNSRIVTDARGLSKGFGYIEFADQSAADEAVRQLDQKVFQGRRMAVQFHVRRERRAGPGMNRGGPGLPVQPSKTLFIGNMSYQMSDRDLNGEPKSKCLEGRGSANAACYLDLFREVRDVLDVRVAIDRRSGQPRGFAHADFVDVASAQRAKELLERKVIYGRQLRVDFSAGSSQVKTV